MNYGIPCWGACFQASGGKASTTDQEKGISAAIIPIKDSHFASFFPKCIKAVVGMLTARRNNVQMFMMYIVQCASTGLNQNCHTGMDESWNR